VEVRKEEERNEEGSRVSELQSSRGKQEEMHESVGARRREIKLRGR
jgi:hypothetical protein